jgi:hypothetical protein
MMQIEFLPMYATWDDWNGNMIHYFAEQQFPIVPESHWMDLANAIALNPVFDKYSVPAPSTFSDWRLWALALTESINGDGA